MSSKACKVLLGSIGCVFGLMSPVSAMGPDLSASVAESKKLGYYRSSVAVEPKSFDWNGHSVSVRECWLEQPGKFDHMILTLNVDGKPHNEHFIANKEQRFLKLEKMESGNDSVSEISFINYLPPSRFVKALPLFGGAYGNYIHYVAFKGSVPKELKLRVGTSAYEKGDGRKLKSKTTWTDTMLKFQIGDEGACDSATTSSQTP